MASIDKKRSKNIQNIRIFAKLSLNEQVKRLVDFRQIKT
jgi:hypothetical protein